MLTAKTNGFTTLGQTREKPKCAQCGKEMKNLIFGATNIHCKDCGKNGDFNDYYKPGAKSITMSGVRFPSNPAEKDQIGHNGY